MMVGGYLWGTLADIHGRRTVLLWSLTMNAIGGLASSFAETYWLFLLLRIVSGIGYVHACRLDGDVCVCVRACVRVCVHV